MTYPEKYSTRSFLGIESLIEFDTGKYFNIPITNWQPNYDQDYSIFLTAYLPSNLSDDAYILRMTGLPDQIYDLCYYHSAEMLILKVPLANHSLTASPKGRVMSICIVRDSIAETLKAYINGKEVLNSSYTPSYAFSSTTPVTVGNYNCMVNYVRAFNKALTIDEVMELHREPGEVADTALHEFVVAEYIMGEGAYKDVGDVYGFGVDAHVIQDTVGRYNYAKSSPLTPQHSELVGFTDEEIL